MGTLFSTLAITQRVGELVGISTAAGVYLVGSQFWQFWSSHWDHVLPVTKCRSESHGMGFPRRAPCVTMRPSGWSARYQRVLPAYPDILELAPPGRISSFSYPDLWSLRASNAHDGCLRNLAGWFQDRVGRPLYH